MILAKTCHQSRNFTVVHDSAKQLNDDLNKISEWMFQCKMAFNPDLSKQAQQILFSRKTHKISHSKLNFNNSPVVQGIFQNHLGLYLHEKLNFFHHIKEKISKAYRGIGVIKKLQNPTLPPPLRPPDNHY